MSIIVSDDDRMLAREKGELDNLLATDETKICVVVKGF